MALKKRKKSELLATPLWMTTFGDMNNLLMVFFVLLMGDISLITQEEFQLMMSPFKGSFGAMTGGSSFAKGRLVELGQNVITLPSQAKGKAVATRLKLMVEAFKPEIEAKKVRLREDERGLVITLTSDAYFDPGSATIRDDAKPILKKVAGILKNIPNFIRIEGHTDNRPNAPPGAKGGFETNWELSAARSVNVLRYFQEEEGIDPKRLSAVAFGQYRPIDDNNTPEGRAFNRRVDIVILKEKFFEKSPDKRIERPLPDEEWR
ncbi:MAG: OmpA family protein [Spirochaetes bacterium]|nr:OmpA family protein [Spirochaetota bacterium]